VHNPNAELEARKVVRYDPTDYNYQTNFEGELPKQWAINYSLHADQSKKMVSVLVFSVTLNKFIE